MSTTPKVRYSPRVERGSTGEETPQTEWWTIKGPDVWMHVMAVASAIEMDQQGRRAMYLRNARLFSNRELMGLGLGKFNRTVTNRDSDRITLNVIRSCVNTAKNKIAAAKPRPVYQSSGGDETIERKAKKRTQYVEGVFDETRNYDLMKRQFVDGAVYGTGFKRWFIENDRVKAERVLAHEVLIDEEEGRYQDPRQLHLVRPILRAKLESMFPKHRERIRGNANEGHNTRDVEFVRVVESWHLSEDPTGKGGRHTICIDNCTLLDEGYDLPHFLFTVFRWEDSLEGFHGESLVDELTGIQIEINRLLRTIQQAQHLACVPRVFLQAGSKVTNEITNQMGGHYEYVGSPPVIATANAMPSEVYQHLDTLIRRAYEITGISQMAAASRKDTGITAGVAIREMNDLQTERFVTQGERYQDLALDDARCVLALTTQLAEKGHAPKVKVSEGNKCQTVDWEDMDEDRYIVRGFPANFLPTTPAGKLQRVAEMQEQGLITSREEALELLDYPDLEKWSSLATAPRKAVEMMLESILEEGVLIRPSPNDDEKTCRTLGNLYLKRAEVNKVEESKRELLLQWLDMVDETFPPAPPAPAPMAPPGGAPGMPPEMGAPPGMPPEMGMGAPPGMPPMAA